MVRASDSNGTLKRHGFQPRLCIFFTHIFFYNFGLSFTLTMLSRLQTMGLLSCCFLSFAVEMDSLVVDN